MLTIISLCAVSAICVIIIYKIKKSEKILYSTKESLHFLLGILIIINLTFAILFAGNVAFNVLTIDSKKEALNAERDAIICEYQSQLYVNDNNLGYHEAMIEVKDWNVEVARNKELCNNLLTKGIISSVWNTMEPIELLPQSKD